MQPATDYQKFNSTWGCTSADGVSTTAGITFLLAVRKGVTAYSCVGLMGKVGPHSEPQKTMGDIQYGY